MKRLILFLVLLLSIVTLRARTAIIHVNAYCDCSIINGVPTPWSEWVPSDVIMILDETANTLTIYAKETKLIKIGSLYKTITGDDGTEQSYYYATYEGKNCWLRMNIAKRLILVEFPEFIVAYQIGTFEMLKN